MSLGYPSVTSIVWQNIRIDQGAIDATIIAEVELVNYSDKRVKHEEVVGLKESFRDIHERYKGKIPGLEEVLKETFFIEEKFFPPPYLPKGYYRSSLQQITGIKILPPEFCRAPRV